MKLTEKTVKQEVETTETVCEITQEEFDAICASTAAHIITNFVGKDADIEDLMAGIMLSQVFAQFVSKLDEKLFGENNTNENPDKKEEK